MIKHVNWKSDINVVSNGKIIHKWWMFNWCLITRGYIFETEIVHSINNSISWYSINYEYTIVETYHYRYPSVIQHSNEKSTHVPENVPFKAYSSGIFPWFSHSKPFSYDFPMMFLWCSYDVPMIFLWFSYDCPIFRWGIPPAYDQMPIVPWDPWDPWGTSCHISAGAPRHRPPPGPNREIRGLSDGTHQEIS